VGHPAVKVETNLRADGGTEAIFAYIIEIFQLHFIDKST